MESRDLEVEIQPLKNEDGKAQENHDAVSGQKETVCRKSTKLSKFSRWRTAAFFLSLFLCLIIVFAFAFIIPCPVRPLSEKTWSRTYRNASLLSPCAFIAAASGTNSSILWERPVINDILSTECSLEKLGATESPGCLVVSSTGLTAIESRTGKILWEMPVTVGTKQSWLNPLLQVPDLDGDNVKDVMLFTVAGDEVSGVIYSGKTGSQIGSSVMPNVRGISGHLMHMTRTGSYYVLFNTENSIYGYALKDIYSMAMNTSKITVNLKQDPEWEKKTNSSSGNVLVYNSDGVQHLVKLPGTGYDNLLITSSNLTELLDGQSLQFLWRINTPNILRNPVLGFFNKDDDRDILIEAENGMDKKQVMILDGASGKVLWEFTLSSKPQCPRPASVNTADQRSAFLFWGQYQSEADNTVPLENRCFLYMLHPSRPQVLLELTNSTDNIAAFKVALFERRRHACYVMLTGPSSQNETGDVTITKRKLKEDISHSQVIWLNKDEKGSDKETRDYFFGLRYSSKV
uniref:Family with sequence similarity 234 member A n=1 Tax=Latimeria chalumnae TaxID=7897 RepID=H3AY15_LATCH|nr:PREDICTED: protein ITFG3 [Latimeria chalumnae]XP_014340948.1 PREDICTED: protein ITFG3 [Latimeria chalumnae]XP_014340949.1 PREDICTED: protein ITFG3 [Latimeria chalumnae]|eukprot:XP_005990874.1 PREDICTED: protein ITFG3 [Latimeria chalumnae]